MRAFQAVELAHFAAHQQAAMQDTAVIQVYSRTFNAYGEPIETYTDAAPGPFGFDPTGGRKNRRADLTALHVDATGRFPLGTVVDPKDRVKVTHRFGMALGTALVFNVQGIPQQGPSGLVLELAVVSP
jgi:hypothetical protein